MWIQAIILLLGIPVGFLIAYLANDELVAGRRWFKTVMMFSLVVGVVFMLWNNWAIVLTCGFILIVAGISLWKSFDRKWTRKRI